MAEQTVLEAAIAELEGMGWHITQTKTGESGKATAWLAIHELDKPEHPLRRWLDAADMLKLGLMHAEGGE